jgi:hypothetical protein
VRKQNKLSYQEKENNLYCEKIKSMNDKRPENPIKNQDIIDFRYELIDRMLAKSYVFGTVCNDNKTNVMTPERKKVLEDVLKMFNEHFILRGYDIG